jgi:hypothetical protein
MIEEVTLPMETRLLCHPFLPLENDLLHALFLRERHQSVQMIRHQQPQMHEPVMPLMSERNGIKDCTRHRLLTKRVLAPFLTADRDEEDRPIGCP